LLVSYGKVAVRATNLHTDPCASNTLLSGDLFALQSGVLLHHCRSNLSFGLILLSLPLHFLLTDLNVRLLHLNHRVLSGLLCLLLCCLSLRSLKDALRCLSKKRRKLNFHI
jgi:hypothetical protein